MRLIFSLLIGALIAASATRMEAAELLMFDSPACEWCELWEAELGEVYPRTAEGGRAPLRRVALHRHKRQPGEYAFVTGVVYTPTFVLVAGGREVGRIHGYPGEDHFWDLLGELIAKLPPPRKACVHDETEMGERTC